MCACMCLCVYFTYLRSCFCLCKMILVAFACNSDVLVRFLTYYAQTGQAAQVQCTALCCPFLCRIQTLLVYETPVASCIESRHLEEVRSMHRSMHRLCNCMTLSHSRQTKPPFSAIYKRFPPCTCTILNILFLHGCEMHIAMLFRFFSLTLAGGRSHRRKTWGQPSLLVCFSCCQGQRYLIGRAGSDHSAKPNHSSKSHYASRELLSTLNAG